MFCFSIGNTGTVVTDEPVTESPETESPETEMPETESPETEAPTVQPTDTNVFSSTTDDSSECFDKNPTKCEERMEKAGENWIKGPCIKGKWVVDNCQMSCELCKANFII